VKKQVHPAVALVLLVAVLGAVWFVYGFVFTGQTVGHVGPPGATRAAPNAQAASEPPHGKPSR
jgi:hypothetical protein